MKESEKIKRDLAMTSDEYQRMSLENKLVGAERLEKFEFVWLPKLKSKFPVENSIPYRWTITTEKFGIVDFYPKGNKVLIREKNDWKKPGMKWIINNLLK